MLSHEIYEKLSNIISQSALNSLSDIQVEALEEELSKLVQEKSGDIDEISYDDLLVAWENATRIKKFFYKLSDQKITESRNTYNF